MRFASILLSAFLFFSCHSSVSTEIRTHPAVNDWPMASFTKVDSANPVLTPGTSAFTDPITKQKVAWELKDVFNPAVAVRDGKIILLYRAQDSIGKPGGTSRIGFAESTDGLHFNRMNTPVFFPDNDEWKKYEWQGGCEDPRLVEDSTGKYVMTYTAFDGVTARLMVATSMDLIHWKKYGPAFANTQNNKYENLWSKSGAIISTYNKNGKIIATPINGKYWMYWGDQFIWLATSTDLIHWTPVEMQAGEKPPVALRGQALNMPSLKIALPTRNKMFDSDLVESGPPAMLTDSGILLIYNGRNIHSIGDTSLPEGCYAAGQAFFDAHDPSKLLRRMDHYFMKPEKPYEITGQVNQVCFLEGLALFNGKWFLYYGTADSKIAVAVKN